MHLPLPLPLLISLLPSLALAYPSPLIERAAGPKDIPKHTGNNPPRISPHNLQPDQVVPGHPDHLPAGLQPDQVVPGHPDHLPAGPQVPPNHIPPHHLPLEHPYPFVPAAELTSPPSTVLQQRNADPFYSQSPGGPVAQSMYSSTLYRPYQYHLPFLAETTASTPAAAKAKVTPPPNVLRAEAPPLPLQKRDAKNDESVSQNDPSNPRARNPMRPPPNNPFDDSNSPFNPIPNPNPIPIPAAPLVHHPTATATPAPNPRYPPGAGFHLPPGHPYRGQDIIHRPDSPGLQQRDAMKGSYNNGPGQPYDLPPWHPNYLPPGHPYLNGPGAPRHSTTTTSLPAAARPQLRRPASLSGQKYLTPYPPAAARRPSTFKKREADPRNANGSPDPYAVGSNADYPAINYPVVDGPQHPFSDRPGPSDPGPSPPPNAMYPPVRYHSHYPPHFPVRWGPGPQRPFLAGVTAEGHVAGPTPPVVKREAKDYNGPSRPGCGSEAGSCGTAGNDSYYLPPGHPYLMGPGAPLPDHSSTTTFPALPRRVGATPSPSHRFQGRDAKDDMELLQERDAKSDGNKFSQHYVQPGYPGNYLPPGDHPYFNNPGRLGTTSTTSTSHVVPRQTRQSFHHLLQGPPNLPLQERDADTLLKPAVNRLQRWYLAPDPGTTTTVPAAARLTPAPVHPMLERDALEDPNPYQYAFRGPVNDQFGNQPQRGAPARPGTTSTVPAAARLTLAPVHPMLERDALEGPNPYQYAFRGPVNDQFGNQLQRGAPARSGTTSTVPAAARLTPSPPHPMQKRDADAKEFDPIHYEDTPPTTTATYSIPVRTRPYVHRLRLEHDAEADANADAQIRSNAYQYNLRGPISISSGDPEPRANQVHPGTTTIIAAAVVTPPPHAGAAGTHPPVLQQRDADGKEFDSFHYEDVPWATTVTRFVPPLETPRLGPSPYTFRRSREKRDAIADADAGIRYSDEYRYYEDNYRSAAQRVALAKKGISAITHAANIPAAARQTPPPSRQVHERDADAKHFDPWNPPRVYTSTTAIPAAARARATPLQERDAKNFDPSYSRSTASPAPPAGTPATTERFWILESTYPSGYPFYKCDVLQQREAKHFDPFPKNPFDNNPDTPPSGTTTPTGAPAGTGPTPPASPREYAQRLRKGSNNGYGFTLPHPIQKRDAKNMEPYDPYHPYPNPNPAPAHPPPAHLGTTTLVSAPRGVQPTTSPVPRGTDRQGRPWEQLYWEGETLRAPSARAPPSPPTPSDLLQLVEREAKEFDPFRHNNNPVAPHPNPPHPGTTTLLSAPGITQPTPPPPPQQPRPYVPRGGRLYAQIHGEQVAPPDLFSHLPTRQKRQVQGEEAEFHEPLAHHTPQRPRSPPPTLTVSGSHQPALVARDSKRFDDTHNNPGNDNPGPPTGTTTMRGTPAVVQHTPTPLTRQRPERPWEEERTWVGEMPIPLPPQSSLPGGEIGYLRPSGAIAQTRTPRANADTPPSLPHWSPHSSSSPRPPTRVNPPRFGH
ncbi:hypothetical protein MMC30_006169 [Trapelia coarctata]|nr:hypothetical protein [Trapelia coarctata]